MFLFLIVSILLSSIGFGLAGDTERIAKGKAEAQVVFYSTNIRPGTLVYAEACRYNSAAKRVNPLELWDLHYLRQLRDAREF